MSGPAARSGGTDVLVRAGLPAAAALPAVIGLLFLVLPLAGLVVRAPWADLGGLLAEPAVRQSLVLSLWTSATATVASVLLGVPLAWLLARSSVPGRGVLRALVTLPLVLPPVVGGVALLVVFGRSGVLGAPLHRLTEISIPFTPAAVVMAQTFVALPFLVLTVEGALRGLDGRYEEAAACLGASRSTVLRRVTLPLVGPSLVAGTVLAWARALGEFGATVTFAGSFPGRTQTLPLSVYQALDRDPRAALALSLLLLAVCVTVLIALRSHWVAAVPGTGR